LRFSRQFANVTIADFIVRSAYQMGKTPLLPVFAQTLGAGEVFLGLIVSVSTLTGIILKPIVGALSDIWGRRSWLILGTIFFTVMPFVYRWISTPEELFTVRIIHGIATAIYGPVTLAFVAEMSSNSRAERLAWFGSARNGGYIVGPAVGGWLLLILDPVSVFTIIGFLSILAFIPLIGISDSKKIEIKKGTFFSHLFSSFVIGSRNISVWVAGLFESFIYMILYAIKAFLPLYASSTSVGFNIAVIGMFFSIQETIRLIFNPLGGKIADKAGYKIIILSGALILAISLFYLTMIDKIIFFIIAAIFMGIAQALIFPAIIAQISRQIDKDNLATSMGLVGSLKNLGKVLGPTLIGVLIYFFDFVISFRILGVFLILGLFIIFLVMKMYKKD